MACEPLEGIVSIRAGRTHAQLNAAGERFSPLQQTQALLIPDVAPELAVQLYAENKFQKGKLLIAIHILQNESW